MGILFLFWFIYLTSSHIHKSSSAPIRLIMSGGRPRTPLEAWKDHINDMFARGHHLDDICHDLAVHWVVISTKTLRRRLLTWRTIEPNQRAPANTTNCRAIQLRVEMLICEFNLRPEEILAVLEHDRTPISQNSLRVIRRKLGITLRVDDPIILQQQSNELNANLTE